MLRVPTLTGVALSVALSAGAVSSQPQEDCLFAANVPFSSGGHCAPDPEEVGRLPAVSVAMGAIGVTSSAVEFVACSGAPFSTAVVTSATGVRTYRITYPLDHGLSQATLTAPITHELGHVLQLLPYASVGALKRHYNSLDRIELGADFLSGVIFKNYLHDNNLRDFQNNLALVGDYNASSRLWHGTPAARDAAFRSGFFYNLDGHSLADAHEEFQRNLYATVMQSAGLQ